MLTPVRAIRDWAAESPDAAAIVGPGLALSVGELWDTALRITGWLREQGVRRDEAVGTAVPPSLEPAFHIALLARGGTSAAYPAGTEVGPDAPLQRVVANRELPGVPRAAQLLFDAGAVAQLEGIDPRSVEPAAYEPDDIVRLLYSSGTTGAPKAIAYTARQFEALLARPRRSGLVDGPFATLLQASSGGTTASFLGAMVARQPHIVPGDPEEGLGLLRERRIEIVEGSPVQLAGLLETARSRDERLPDLRILIASGAPLAPSLAAALREWFAAEVYEGFGSTESGFIGARLVDGGAPRGIAVGEAGVEVEIVDDEHRPVAPGTAGRLRVRTPGQASGYLGGVEAGPHRGFHDGWFFTGDLGRLDGGELHLLGRDDDLLNLGGQKIMPQRIEQLVTRRPEIREAIAAAVTDRLGVRQLALALIGDPVEDPAGLVDEIRRELGGIAPVAVVRLAGLPRTETGKPKRGEVAALLQRRLDAASAGAPPAAERAPTRGGGAPPAPIRALREWAAESPDDPALIGPRLVLSVGELWDTALRIAGWLREQGVRPEEAVGAAVPPSLEPAFLIALLVRGGRAATTPGNVEVGPAAPLQRIIGVQDFPWLPPEVQLRFDAEAISRLASVDPAAVEPAAPLPDEVVWLTYSSGSTGAPKAVMRTVRALEAIAAQPRRQRLARAAYFSLQPGTAAASQTAFLAAMSARRPHLAASAAVEENLELLQRQGIEIVEGSPFQFDQLLAAARRSGVRLPELREMHSGGAPLALSLAAALSDWFGAEVYDGYGSTETGFIASRRVDGAGEHGGVLDDGVEVEIVDDEHRPLPPGAIGRIRVRSAGMAIGYVGEVELGPHRGIRDGWFYPGDLGRLEAGEVYVLGREDDLMNVGGQKIMPQRVEDAALRQPGIREAVACTVVDRLGVRQLALAIVGEPVDDPAELTGRLRGPLGIAPSIIVRLAEIPRTETGKPKRDEVAELLQKRLDAGGTLV